MAEGVACVDGNGSFDNQNRRSCTYRVRVDLQDRLARLLYRHGQSLKSPQRNPTGGYRYPLKHSESVKFQVRTWNIPESECFNNRASFGVETSGRFLSSVHVDTAALLACLEDRLVLGRRSFVGFGYQKNHFHQHRQRPQPFE